MEVLATCLHAQRRTLTRRCAQEQEQRVAPLSRRERGRDALLEVEEGPQLLAPRRMPQLAQRLGLERSEARQHVAHGFGETGVGRRFHRRAGVLVLDEVTKMKIPAVA